MEEAQGIFIFVATLASVADFKLTTSHTKSREPDDYGDRLTTPRSMYVRIHHFLSRPALSLPLSVPSPFSFILLHPLVIAAHSTLTRQTQICANEGEDPETLFPPDNRAPRLFLDNVSGLQPGMVLELTDPQVHYILGVMRLRNGDLVRVFDGSSGEFLAKVCGVGSSRGKVRRAGAAAREQPVLCVESRTRSQLAPADTLIPKIELLFAPIRKQRLKILVEKAVEVGVWRLTPILTARTQGSAADPEVLRKIGVFAVEASEQSERMDVPRVGTNPVPLSLLLDSVQANSDGNPHDSNVDDTTVWHHRLRALDTIFVCKERDADATPLLKALEDFERDHTANKIREGRVHSALLVGPEGGFSREEIEMMARCPSVRFVSLGQSVLRAETASVYALSCWNAFWCGLASPPR